MKLSSKSRYGTRLMLDLASHFGGEFIQLKEIAGRQGISLKYLEQIMIPLKKAKYVKGVRGARGGYKLSKSPEKITVGEIVALLESGSPMTECSENPETCKRSESCPTRLLWKEAADALFERLNTVTLADLLKKEMPAGDTGR